MAHHTWIVSLPRGSNLRDGLDTLRDGIHKLLDELGAINQMTDQQVATEYGFADATAASAAKLEFASDVGNLKPGSDGTASGRALQQLLDQFA